MVVDNNVTSTDSRGDQYYGAYKRIKTDKNPSLICTGTKLNKFKDNTDMYVGTLTADEMSFAGAADSTNYTHYLMNSYAKSNNLSWWGLSPEHSINENWLRLFVFLLYSKGSLQANYVNVNYYSRPAISLKSNTQISSGTGTKENPYIIK